MNSKGLYYLAVACTSLSLLASILFTTVWVLRRRLPYNELGRYFDGEVVLHEQGVLVYGTLALLSILMLALFAVITWRIRHAVSTKP